MKNYNSLFILALILSAKIVEAQTPYDIIEDVSADRIEKDIQKLVD